MPPPSRRSSLPPSRRGSLPPSRRGSLPPSRRSSLPPRSLQPRHDPVLAIAIGGSSGGPGALGKILGFLSHDLAVPIFVAQHMPPNLTRVLAERLGAGTRFPIAEAVHDELVEPGRVYLAPSGYHLTLTRRGANVHVTLRAEEPAVNGFRPSIDALFASVAQIFGSGGLGVILTGIGRDGVRGSARIVEHGGRVIVQDEASCVVPDMPANVRREVATDGVYPLDRIASELNARVRSDAGPPRIGVVLQEWR